MDKKNKEFTELAKIVNKMDGIGEAVKGYRMTQLPLADLALEQGTQAMAALREKVSKIKIAL